MSLRVLLAIAALGAIAVLLSFLGRIAELAGVVAIAAVALLVPPAPAGESAGAVRWRRLLEAGAVTCAVALPLSLLLDTIGGLLAGVGAALVIVAVAFGWPQASDGGSSARPGPPPTGPPEAPHAP